MWNANFTYVRKYMHMNYNIVSEDRIPVGGRDFPYSSRPALGPNQPPIQLIPGLSPGGKATRTWLWPPTPSSTEVEQRVELYAYSPLGSRGLF